MAVMEAPLPERLVTTPLFAPSAAPRSSVAFLVFAPLPLSPLRAAQLWLRKILYARADLSTSF